MHWCCTERPTRPGQADAYVGDRPVIESLAEEIEALVGPDVFVEITRRAARDTDVDRGGKSATGEQLVGGRAEERRGGTGGVRRCIALVWSGTKKKTRKREQ